MPIIRLTKRTIDPLPFAPTGQVLYYDDQLRGFGLRVGARRKAFFAEGQIGRRNVRITVGPYPLISPEEARKAATQHLAAMARGEDPRPQEVPEAAILTLGSAVDAFFEARPNLSLVTIPNYRRTFDLYLADWQDTPLAEISRQMVLTRHRALTGSRGGVTANNAMRHLRSVYNVASATHDLPANPVHVLTHARAWAPERRRRSIVPLHALKRWWDAVIRLPNHARDFLLIALFTGMRRSEILALRWENIDLAADTLLVPRTKNGDPLTLPLSTPLKAVLRSRRTASGESAWLFPGVGKSGHMEEPKSFVQVIAKEAGVKFTLHDLRRTYITIAESLDIPAYALRQLLNHRSNSDVTGGYIVIGVDRLRAPVERIAGRIMEAVNAGPADAIRSTALSAVA